MKLLLLTMALTLAVFASDAKWENDYKEALIVAEKSNKDVYMLITSQSCKWCRKFESITLQDNEVMKELEKDYVLLHLNRDTDYIPEHYKKKRIPRHYFITSKGETIYTFLGYWNPEDFISFVKEVQTKK